MLKKSYSASLIWTRPGGGSYLYIQTDCFKDVDHAAIPILFQLLRLTKAGPISPSVKQFGDPQNDQISVSFLSFLSFAFLNPGFSSWDKSSWFFGLSASSLPAVTGSTVVSLWCQQMEKGNVFTVWMKECAGARWELTAGLSVSAATARRFAAVRWGKTSDCALLVKFEDVKKKMHVVLLIFFFCNWAAVAAH